MITLIFEAHGTTFDNEAHLASGHNDIPLSPLGEQQSKEMGERYKDDNFDAIFCSDLQRAYKSAEIGFGNKWQIVKDVRLRECDYGDLTQHPSEEVDEEKPKRLHTPFPNGESYDQTKIRIISGGPTSPKLVVHRQYYWVFYLYKNSRPLSLTPYLW
jgi:broad specificity phosphatase PhoE